MPGNDSLSTLEARFINSGQGHLIEQLHRLQGTDGYNVLLDQLQKLDVERVCRIFKLATTGGAQTDGDQAPLEPLPTESFDTTCHEIPTPTPSAPQNDEALSTGDLHAPPVPSLSSRIRHWENIGLDAIEQGKVAVLLLAGGQGTRLGSSAPKGCYDIGLPSHKSLFHLQGDRIARLQELATQLRNLTRPGIKLAPVVIPWYVMTSGPTRRDTVKYFEEHHFFGLDPKHVIFFEQGTLPCFSNDGKILLETDRQLAAAPDGNGGVYAALLKEGVLADMAHRGIEHIHAYCVDNCLVRVADPVFIGFSISKGADCGAKVVPKEAPEEPVGVVCRRNGRYRVVEYSEIDGETTKLRDFSGRLLFRAANIANHYYTRRFLERVVRDIEPCLSYHIAKKKIPFYDTASSQTIKPSQPNGIKLELFVFDVLPYTQRVAVLEVPRADEFAPLKNAPGAGVDCPETSRDALKLQHRRFLEAVGAHIHHSSSDTADIEISGRVSYAGEALFQLHGVHLTPPIHIETVQDIERLSKK